MAVEKGAQELKGRKRLYFQMIRSCTHFLSLYRFPDLTSVATLNTYPGSVRTWVPFKMKRIVFRLCMASIFLATETAGMSVFNHHAGRLVFLLVKGIDSRHFKFVKIKRLNYSLIQAQWTFNQIHCFNETQSLFS